ncbi:efflux RND transporter permease subunit [Mangrovibacterium lignilyticum]|uniref:efflux RND transporter permease subunit n=1 Tax=Mangrovibacterium lignilyticum TaxID=2668052 RepID=UPI0013D42E75|nr:efflux RND transporter permease subunit [Mangrovibacterium lignilyticum]
MNFVKASLKYRQVSVTVLVMVFVAGIYSLWTMPRREDPQISSPMGLVIAYYPGATAIQVEEQLTSRIEEYLFQFPEVRKEKTYSTTCDGELVVNVWLNDGITHPEIFWSKLRHQLIVAKVLELPDGVIGPIVNSDFGDTEALLISVESDQSSYTQLKEYAKLLEDHIRTIPATSKIKRIGEQKEQISVYFNPDKLAQYHVNLEWVVKVLQSQNTISSSGVIKTDRNNVALHTEGYYNTETELANQVIGTSEIGSVIRLSDIATIKREYQEPENDLRVNGKKAVIVSVQMNEGNNIVKYGEQVDSAISVVKELIPSNVEISLVANQPLLVDENVSRFLREFLIAILAVIVVILLLLPFRIAAVAATAIPITIAVTFTVLHAIGVELHQVSLAALIVVLGMVVDDAIVVADNYVELLDSGEHRWTAAWRSANDLVIPVFTATITIIAAFLPMTILKGAIGEFIHDLPITVTVALASSFVVAMFFTPMLCFAFIKKGLHDRTVRWDQKEKKKSLLDHMQTGYGKIIQWCVKHAFLTVAGSLLTIALAGLLFQLYVGQKFFPAAERNQFVVELWMPTGTKVEQTLASILKVESWIKDDDRVVSYATFTGMSAPRVYYNFSPEFPVSNYAQMLINTTSEKTTDELAAELSQEVEALVPEGTVQVKLMQQGLPLQSPVEVRIFGDDIHTLKKIGASVKNVLRESIGSHFVHDDFREDYFGASIQLNNQASRLGFTTGSVAKLMYISTSGASVSRMYEGDNVIAIVLRMDESKRRSIEALENMYIESPVTGENVPLRQIAQVVPQWQAGRIMHRNGMRCLTVGSETTRQVLPSALLNEIQPKIAEIKLPVGYRIAYGGEQDNKQEVMGKMIVALGISLVAIFLILLFQFRNIKEVSFVMLTIPLSLFGAVSGLAITESNFGFTAFLGIISLSGIVVRNAIILIEHTNELINLGMDIRTAAMDAAERRLRPIFLTAMSAAFGVVPMILSGSSLWAPLASVIAFGVVWSMIMALITIPVLYLKIIRRKDKEYLSDEKSYSYNKPDLWGI